MKSNGKCQYVLFAALSILMVASLGCGLNGPKTSTECYSKWRVIELRDEFGGDYDRA